MCPKKFNQYSILTILSTLYSILVNHQSVTDVKLNIEEEVHCHIEELEPVEHKREALAAGRELREHRLSEHGGLCTEQSALYEQRCCTRTHVGAAQMECGLPREAQLHRVGTRVETGPLHEEALSTEHRAANRIYQYFENEGALRPISL